MSDKWILTKDHSKLFRLYLEKRDRMTEKERRIILEYLESISMPKFQCDELTSEAISPDYRQFIVAAEPPSE